MHATRAFFTSRASHSMWSIDLFIEILFCLFRHGLLPQKQTRKAFRLPSLWQQFRRTGWGMRLRPQGSLRQSLLQPRNLPIIRQCHMCYRRMLWFLHLSTQNSGKFMPDGRTRVRFTGILRRSKWILSARCLQSRRNSLQSWNGILLWRHLPDALGSVPVTLGSIR